MLFIAIFLIFQGKIALESIEILKIAINCEELQLRPQGRVEKPGRPREVFSTNP
jgi:hypothetical protein